VILPQNPGLKFSPPPIFNSSTAIGQHPADQVERG
jgi:hypothetical protein